MVNERAFWVAWSTIPGVGPISLRRLQKYFGTLADAWNASAADLVRVEGLGPQTAESILIERQKIDPDYFLEQHERENPGFWTPADPEYPRLLLEIPDSPPVLYYTGHIRSQELTGQAAMVAIVGTRAPSEYGRKWTQRITKVLAERGFTIVSGLAEGIDTVVHRSCIAVGGRTIAVLGSGVNYIYPWSNQGLYHRIAESGLILSEHPANTQPDRMFFPRRNRIIAGLCRATLVMEAPARSGGLITAHYANEYGREVYVLPGSLDNPRAIGCLKLINKGAHVIEGETELLEMLDLLPHLDQPSPQEVKQPSLPLNLTPEMELVLRTLIDLCQQVDGESVPLDVLVQKTGLTTGAALGALTSLELEELVVTLPGMRYQPR